MKNSYQVGYLYGYMQKRAAAPATPIRDLDAPGSPYRSMGISTGTPSNHAKEREWEFQRKEQELAGRAAARERRSGYGVAKKPISGFQQPSPAVAPPQRGVAYVNAGGGAVPASLSNQGAGYERRVAAQGQQPAAPAPATNMKNTWAAMTPDQKRNAAQGIFSGLEGDQLATAREARQRYLARQVGTKQWEAAGSAASRRAARTV
jgi:hypothetical protein